MIRAGRKRHSLKRGPVGVLLAALLMGTVTTGCDGPLAVMDDAINELHEQPAAWERTLGNTIKKLAKAGSDLAGEVADLLANTIGQTSNLAFCATDFFGRRVTQKMEAIRHELDNSRPKPTIVPVVCNTNPVTSVEAGKTALVTFYGYDFSEFAKEHKFTTSLVYKDGTVAVADVGSVVIAHNYQMSVDIQAVTYAGIDRTRGPKLVLGWDDTEVEKDPGGESALPVIIPAPTEPTRSNIDVQATAYAGSGLIILCNDIEFKYKIGEDWRIDTSKGDAGHPGVHEAKVDGNRQANETLREYNYQAVAENELEVDGEICAAGGWGAGAIFDRTYTIYLVKE